MLTAKIALYLEDIEHPIGRIVNVAIAGLVLVSTGIFIAETYPLAPDLRSLTHKIDRPFIAIPRTAIDYRKRSTSGFCNISIACAIIYERKTSFATYSSVVSATRHLQQ